MDAFIDMHLFMLSLCIDGAARIQQQFLCNPKIRLYKIYNINHVRMYGAITNTYCVMHV